MAPTHREEGAELVLDRNQPPTEWAAERKIWEQNSAKLPKMSATGRG